MIFYLKICYLQSMGDLISSKKKYRIVIHHELKFTVTLQIPEAINVEKGC